jgi:hypothetical protein
MLAAFGADRRQLEEGRHRLAVFQQHALGFRQVLHPGQQVGEGRRDAVERLLVGLGGRSAPAAERAARLGDTCAASAVTCRAQASSAASGVSRRCVGLA